MVNFVLVHGTSHGAWCWRYLSPLLRAKGHDVYTPTLTGLGESSHLLPKIDRITLGTHIEDVTNTMFYEDLSEVVLVGHSYAGMVITGVASKEPQRLAHLVYYDAYVPFEGENEISLWPPEEQARVQAEIAKGSRFRPLPPDGTPGGFARFLGIVDPSLADWAQRRFTPHPISTYEDPPPMGSQESASIPRTFIHCTVGPFAPWFGVFAERARKLGWEMHDLAAGHDAMLIDPKGLADILLGIAGK
jgi:pimeloyl-ACP methyl ester carboxylesterase